MKLPLFSQKEKPDNRKPKFYNWFFQIGSGLLIVYLLILTGQSVFQNYKTRQHIQTLEEEIAKLDEENQTLKNLNLYYQTNSFRELEARRKLFYRKPGEKVVDVLVPKREEQSEPAQNLLTRSVTQKNENSDHRSNPEKWLDFLLKK